MKAQFKQKNSIKDNEFKPPDYIFTVPTRLKDVFPAFRNTHIKTDIRVEELRTKTRIEKLSRRSSAVHSRSTTTYFNRVTLHHKFNSTSFRPNKRLVKDGRKAGYMQLKTHKTVSGVADDDCLKEMAILNTDCLLTLYTMFSLVDIKDGQARVTNSLLARRRGWKSSSVYAKSRSGSQTKRERLIQHLELLSKVEFGFSYTKGGGTKWSDSQLLLGPLSTGANASSQSKYKFHPLLWKEMTTSAKKVFIDTSILTANVQTDEWSVRLLFYMSSRWGPNWVSKRLDENGGQLTERLGVLLNGANISFEEQLKNQGQYWLRKRFAKAMDKLVNWTPRPLIGGYEINEDADCSREDRITFRPTQPVADCYTNSRSKSIASRNRRTEKNDRKGNSK